MSREEIDLDEIDAVHRDATSAPWEHEWEVVEEPDEYGYYPQREVRAEKDGMHLATFAYLQHLQLFLAALRLPEITAELRTLRDLADETRTMLYRDFPHSGFCATVECNCPLYVQRARAALARLDGEDTG